LVEKPPLGFQAHDLSAQTAVDLFLSALQAAFTAKNSSSVGPFAFGRRQRGVARFMAKSALGDDGNTLANQPHDDATVWTARSDLVEINYSIIHCVVSFSVAPGGAGSGFYIAMHNWPAVLPQSA
jgi:hypothetical protein